MHDGQINYQNLSTESRRELAQLQFVRWCNHQTSIALSAMEAHALFAGGLIYMADAGKGHTGSFPSETESGSHPCKPA
jgi:hypothetical protein